MSGSMKNLLERDRLFICLGCLRYTITVWIFFNSSEDVDPLCYEF